MAYINDTVFDSGLTLIDGTTVRVDICSAEPTTYALATTDGANSLGNKTGLTVSALQNGGTDGRQVTVPAITDGSVTETGTATHWAVTNGTDTLWATGSLTSQAVTDLNQFTLGAITINFRDASNAA